MKLMYNIIISDKRIFDENDYQLPFPLFFDNSSATCMDAPTMGFLYYIYIFILNFLIIFFIYKKFYSHK